MPIKNAPHFFLFPFSTSYSILPDVVPFLEYCKARGIPLGVTTNTPTRTIDTVLPLIGLHDYFKWFVCSQDAGAEKPDASIFNQSLELAQYWVPDLKPEEILHIGKRCMHA